MISDTSTPLSRRLSRGLPTTGTMLLVLVLGLSLTACGDDNGGMGLEPPTVAGSVDNQSLLADDNPVEIGISGLFDGEELTLSASSDSDAAAASLDGNTLTVTPQNGGTATITVTAENDAGSAETSFEANIDLPIAPDPPDDS